MATKINKVIEASLLAFDLSKVKEQLLELKACGVNDIHYDVMDNIFVKNTAFNVEWLELIHQLGMRIHVHFMVTHDYEWILRFIKYPGIVNITFHPENKKDEDIKKCIDLIHRHHIKAGFAIKPKTTFAMTKSYFKLLSVKDEHNQTYYDIDYVTIMSVEPGFGGQKYIMGTEDKAKQICLQLKNKCKDQLNIQIDGGINLDYVKLNLDYVDSFVIGTALMKYSGDKKDFVNLLKK